MDGTDIPIPERPVDTIARVAASIYVLAHCVRDRVQAAEPLDQHDAEIAGYALRDLREAADALDAALAHASQDRRAA